MGAMAGGAARPQVGGGKGQPQRQPQMGGGKGQLPPQQLGYTPFPPMLPQMGGGKGIAGQPLQPLQPMPPQLGGGFEGNWRDPSYDNMGQPVAQNPLQPQLPQFNPTADPRDGLQSQPAMQPQLGGGLPQVKPQPQQMPQQPVAVQPKPFMQQPVQQEHPRLAHQRQLQQLANAKRFGALRG